MAFSWDLISTSEFDKFYNQYEGEKTFLQTSKYAQFREKMGEKVFLFGVKEDEKIIGTCLIQKISAKRGTFLHVPHGPLLNAEGGMMNAELMKWFLKKYVKFGKNEKCDFARISPIIQRNKNSDFSPLDSRGDAEGRGDVNKLPKPDIFKKTGFRPAPVHLVNPEKTWTLDITKDEESILAQMRKSTRYEVRRIEKVGITTKMGNAPEDFEIFWDLHSETVKRQKFVPFSKESTEIEIEVFGDDCQIFSAAVENQYQSSSVILFDHHAAYYHQGASVYSKLPVAHATIWAAILEAQKRGCTEFNFWGVCGEEEKAHPWYGLSRFKRGFGGEERNYLHAQDYPLTKKYWLNFAIEKYRKWKRNY